MQSFKRESNHYGFTVRCTVHVVQSAVAIVSRPSVRPSDRPSVRPSIFVSLTLIYRGRIGWVSCEEITRVISLGLHRSSEPQHRQSSLRGTPSKFEWNGMGAVFSRKPATSLSLGKDQGYC